MYNTTTQEQKIIDWFQNIWDSHKYDRETRREITDHIQDDINLNRFEEEDLAELGEWVWDDFSELKMALSRDTCKNLQDGLKTLAISKFQRFQVEDSSPLPMAGELTVNSLHNLRIF